MKKMELRTFKEQRGQSPSAASKISPATARQLAVVRMSSTTAPVIWEKQIEIVPTRRREKFLPSSAKTRD